MLQNVVQPCQPKNALTLLGRDALVVDRHTHSHSDYWAEACDLGRALRSFKLEGLGKLRCEVKEAKQ